MSRTTKDTKPQDSAERIQVPMATEESTQLGDIKINLSVVASIVRLATMSVQGVAAVGGGFVDGIAEIFTKKESDRGVKVVEDEGGLYVIEIRVILNFGVDLAKVASQIQQSVKDQVLKMTHKTISRVDVMVDGIRMPSTDVPAREDWTQPHMD